MPKNVELVCLIYKSRKYLQFICKQLASPHCRVPGWEVGVRIVANDPTPEVEAMLKEREINHTIYRDPAPNDFYLNRVYRCWNFGATSSQYDNVCFINSDMGFSENWLRNLLKHHDGSTIPCSRLVESGRIPVATDRHAIAMNFGTNPDEFNQAAFETYADMISADKVAPGGLFMPCVFEKQRFIESGMYPAGNVFVVDGQLYAGYPNDRPVYKSGDAYFFEDVLGQRYGMKHITALDSVVYHIQEGERSD
jgi:hypothetical protein